jgi:pyruvate/2-oxoglutarate dehydrogenase complex dihydrolipoamide dehydrogenase (E3) component
VRLHGTCGGGEVVIEGSHLLVAAGRTPNTDGIGLEVAGVERDGRGYVKMDEQLRTTAAGVGGGGDCAGSPQFTHIGFDDFRVVRVDRGVEVGQDRGLDGSVG